MRQESRQRSIIVHDFYGAVAQVLQNLLPAAWKLCHASEKSTDCDAITHTQAVLFRATASATVSGATWAAGTFAGWDRPSAALVFSFGGPLAKKSKSS